MSTNTVGTTSMQYSSFTQRSWIASVNSKRDIAIDTLKNQLSTKYAELSWSSNSAVDLSISAPPADPDAPAQDAQLKFPFSVAGITPVVDANGLFTNGCASVYTPPGSDVHFDFVQNSDGQTAGYENIRYLSSVPQLCEIELEVVLASGSTVAPHTLFASIYTNGKADNDAVGNTLPGTFVRTVVNTDSDVAEAMSATALFKHRMVLSQNNKVKAIVWKSDSNNGSSVECFGCRLSVKTLP
uniref:Uncharacterized protein n=1 Tax=viral metagenome TaxID=1070528 RepID=A0A6C0LMD7_9ZZZZ